MFITAKSRSSVLLVICVAVSIFDLDDAFSIIVCYAGKGVQTTFQHDTVRCRQSTALFSSPRSKGDDDSGHDKNEKISEGTSTSESKIEEDLETSFPCLPAIGGSSFDNTIKLGDDAKPVAFVGSQKFELQYTCNICETRNSIKVSRLAYRKGLVIARCKECDSKHLIADNIGWIGGFNGDTSIEEYYETVGRGDEVNRVSKDVFKLEETLYTGNDGDDNDSISDIKDVEGFD